MSHHYSFELLHSPENPYYTLLLKNSSQKFPPLFLHKNLPNEGSIKVLTLGSDHHVAIRLGDLDRLIKSIFKDFQLVRDDILKLKSVEGVESFIITTQDLLRVYSKLENISKSKENCSSFRLLKTCFKVVLFSNTLVDNFRPTQQFKDYLEAISQQASSIYESEFEKYLEGCHLEHEIYFGNLIKIEQKGDFEKEDVEKIIFYQNQVKKIQGLINLAFDANIWFLESMRY